MSDIANSEPRLPSRCVDKDKGNHIESITSKFKAKLCLSVCELSLSKEYEHGLLLRDFLVRLQCLRKSYLQNVGGKVCQSMGMLHKWGF